MGLKKKDPEIRRNMQGKVGSYMIREQRRDDMERAINRGLHFEDAADVAGIPYEIAIAASRSDPKFIEWYALSEERPRIRKRTMKKYEPKTSLQIKSDFVNKLSDVGLFDKIADMAEMADPHTEEGKQILGFFMRYIVKDILPRETASKIEHSEGRDYDKLTDAELLEALHKRREQRLEYSEEIKNAEILRLEHTKEVVEEEINETD